MSSSPQQPQNGQTASFGTASFAEPIPSPHGSIEAQAADALLNIERWPALRPFLLRGIVEALSKEAGMDQQKK